MAEYELNPDTGKYDDLYETQFPADVDIFDNKIDLTGDLAAYYKLWAQYVQSGDTTSAKQIIEAHPDIKRCITSAQDLNRLGHSVQAIERTVHDNLDEWLNKKVNNEIWIHDILLNKSVWVSQTDGTYKYTYRRDDIVEKSIPQVFFSRESKRAASKSMITVVSQDGYVEFIAEKKPTISLSIETMIIRLE